MKKVVTKVLSVLLLAALLVSPVAAAAPERQAPVTDAPVLDELEQSWLDRAQAATSFTVQLVEPSLAVYGSGNAIMQDSSGKLDVNAPAAVAYLQKINDGLDSFISQAESLLGRNLEVLYRYDAVLNGFSAKMSFEEASLLRQHPDVEEVYPDEIYQLDTDVSPAFIGANQIWDGTAVVNGTGYKGEGTIAGIIDTGINMEHPSFQPSSPQDPGWTAVNPYGNGVYKGLCATNPSTHTCNSKLIGVYDMLNTGNGHDTEDHGSHTAGTTAGNTVEVHYGDAVVTISGMAPRANVISYRVCDASGCATSASTAAVNQAILDGANSLNYSIGPRNGPARSPWLDSTEVAFLEAFKVGISTATSAGNSGPADSTVYKLPPWALVVGNSTHGRIFGYPITINPGPNQQESIAILAGEETADPLTIDLVGKELVWGGNHNNKLGCDPWAAGSLAGKVAIVQRGTCNFSLKLTNMQNAGAIFGIVYNNAPGAPIVMGATDPLTNPIPAGMISMEAGLAMEAIATSPMTVDISKTIGSGTQADWGDIMNDGSSRGPITNFEMLEPDISAPGTNILAPYSGSYAGHPEQDLMSGTSMAGPHVAGATLLMRSVFPTWTPAAIRSALIMTANPNMQNHDLADANPFQMGNGRVDMSKAALTGLVMEETYAGYVAANPNAGGDIRKLNIPSYQNSNCLGGCSFTRTVKSVSDQAATYTVVVEKSEGVEVTVSPATFTIPAGGTQLIKVDVNPTIAAGGTWQFGRVIFTTSAKFVSGKDVSDTAMSLAVKAEVSGSTLPGVLTETIDQETGSHTFANQMNAKDITNMSNARFGLTPATIVTLNVPEDTTNENPYDNLSQVGIIKTTCPKNNQRLVVQVLETPSLDIDIYMGNGSNPHPSLQKTYSADPGSLEYINEINPTWPTGSACWILVQNWEASEPGAIDPVKIAYAFVPKTGTNNFTVTTPTGAIPKLTPFNVTVNWNLSASFDQTEVWYGYMTLGTTNNIKDDVAKMEINLFKGYVEPEPEPELDKFIFLPLVLK